MNRIFKARSLRRSIMHLFGSKNHNITRENHRDDYFRNYYFNKELCDGIELIASIERMTKKDTAQMLIERGLSSYMGNQITEYVKEDVAAKQEERQMKMTRFVRELRRYAKAQGVDISKFI